MWTYWLQRGKEMCRYNYIFYKLLLPGLNPSLDHMHTPKYGIYLQATNPRPVAYKANQNAHQAARK